MLSRFLEGDFGQFLAPDPSAPADKQPGKDAPNQAPSEPSTERPAPKPIGFSNLMEMIAPDPKYYESLKHPVERPASAFQSPPPQSRSYHYSTPSRSSRKPPKTPNSKHLSSQVLSAAEDTTRTLSSPTLMWESLRSLFMLCASTRPLRDKQVTKFKTSLGKNPSYASARCANMGIVPDGFTLLHACAFANNLVLAEVLLELKSTGSSTEACLVSVLTPDLQGRSSLHIAAEKGHVDMIRLLKRHLTLELGNLPPIGDNAPVDLIGRTPLGWAMTSHESQARKNVQQIQQELFSPGDNSICPNTPSVERLYSGGALEFGYADMPGWRVEMEDALCCYTNNADDDEDRCCLGFFGVFDGHSDSGKVSKFVADHLYAEYKKRIQNDVDVTHNEALAKACLNVDDQLQEFMPIQAAKGGSTAVVAVVLENEIIVGNVGDSRAILVKLKGATTGEEQTEEQKSEDVEVIPLSRDHKPNLESERLRIENAGLEVISEVMPKQKKEDDTEQQQQEEEEQLIWKVKQGSNKLAVSRAFGDFDFKSIKEQEPQQQPLIALPEIQVHKRSNDDLFLILACDGVWDVLSNDECGKFVLKKQKDISSLADVGDALLKECLDKGSTDNMSVVIVSLAASATGPVKRLSF